MNDEELIAEFQNRLTSARANLEELERSSRDEISALRIQHDDTVSRLQQQVATLSAQLEASHVPALTADRDEWRRKYEELTEGIDSLQGQR